MVAAKVGGSLGLVAKRSEAMALATMKDANVPRAMPASARRRVLLMTRELHAAGGGAQGHADADFLRLPRHRIGDDAVDSERRENQAKRGEEADE